MGSSGLSKAQKPTAKEEDERDQSSMSETLFVRVDGRQKQNLSSLLRDDEKDRIAVLIGPQAEVGSF